MEIDFGLTTRSCYCSFEWLNTCSNYVEYVQLRRSDDKNATFYTQAFKSFPS